MTIQLVTKPFARIVARPTFDIFALDEFADEAGLEDLTMADGKPRTDTPIGRIFEEASRPHEGCEDLLSELAGRFCYRSFDKGRGAAEYLGNVISERHGNVLAHANVTFLIAGVSRALTHELIRHHVGTNPSQESQRYVTAEGGEIEVVGFKAMRAVVPPIILKMTQDSHEGGLLNQFEANFTDALVAYHHWLDKIKARLPADMPATLKKKRANEAARCFLPNAAETRLVWTMNLRAARNVIEQRGDVHADLEIRRLAVAFAHELKRVAPLSFFDAEIYTADDGFEAVKVKYTKV